MASEFSREFFSANRIVKADLHCARQPREQDLDKIKAELKSLYDATEVLLDVSVDESLLSGYVLQVGDRVFDNSGRHQLDKMMEGKPITITDPNMTRFMMTLDDAVDLVVYAFQHGHNGDLFVQKAPAATLETLATALKQIYAKVDPKYGETEVKVIGTRHGEKLYETLVTREEMAKAIDMGNYYRIPCDTRDLNYDKFFTEGSEDLSHIEDYHSHNTRRLDVEGMKEQLLRLRFIQEDLGMVERAKPRDIRSE